jgi:hypothetical protein
MRGRLGHNRRAGCAAAGFSFVELVLSLSLLAAALTGIGAVTHTAIRMTALHERRLDTQQAARRGLERVMEELRWAEAVIGDPACGGGLCPSRVRVRVPRGNPYRADEAYEVTFQHNPAQRELERRVGGGVNNLASLIRHVDFRYLDADGSPAADPGAVTHIRLTLVAAPPPGAPFPGAPFTVESEVGLRNRRPAERVLPSPTPVWRPAPRWLRSPAPPAGTSPPAGTPLAPR